MLHQRCIPLYFKLLVPAWLSVGRRAWQQATWLPSWLALETWLLLLSCRESGWSCAQSFWEFLQLLLVSLLLRWP
jgi:hypothetical protein